MTEKIFVIDDEVNLLNILKIQLGRAGYDVSTFTSPLDALQKIAQEPPDLLIVDYMMPVMDGLEFTKKVKAEANTGSIPIIILSAVSQTNDKLKAFEAGAEDYVTKPYDIKEVSARIRSALTRSMAQKKKMPPERKPSEGLAGKLGTVSLSNLIQLLEMDAKTGILHIRSSKGTGDISFSKGKVVAASMGALKGVTAVYRLVYLQEGEFEFENLETVSEHQITTNNQNLLLDAARHKDELERFKEIFPSLDLRISLKVGDIREKYASLREMMKPEFLAILDVLAENKTIDQIITESHQDDLLVLEELKTLLSSRLIEVHS